MPRALGHIQLKILTALRRHGREARLDSLAAFVAGLIDDLGARLPYGRSPSRSQYVSAVRAVAALERRGLVETAVVGTAKGRMEWRIEDGRLRAVWRFRHPGKRLIVRAAAPVDSLELESSPLQGGHGDNTRKGVTYEFSNSVGRRNAAPDSRGSRHDV